MFADPLFLIVLLGLGVVVVILASGIGNFGKPGPEAAHRSNKLMRWRIYAQAGAVVLILLFFFLRRVGG